VIRLYICILYIILRSGWIFGEEREYSRMSGRPWYTNVGVRSGGEWWWWRVEWYPDQIIIYTFMTELYRYTQLVRYLPILPHPSKSDVIYCSARQRLAGNIDRESPYNNIILLLLYDLPIYHYCYYYIIMCSNSDIFVFGSTASTIFKYYVSCL